MSVTPSIPNIMADILLWTLSHSYYKKLSISPQGVKKEVGNLDPPSVANLPLWREDFQIAEQTFCPVFRYSCDSQFTGSPVKFSLLCSERGNYGAYSTVITSTVPSNTPQHLDSFTKHSLLPQCTYLFFLRNQTKWNDLFFNRTCCQRQKPSTKKKKELKIISSLPNRGSMDSLQEMWMVYGDQKWHGFTSTCWNNTQYF